MLEGEEEEKKETKSPLKDYAEGAVKSFADIMEDIKNRANDVDETMAQINRTTISLNQSLGGSEVYLQTIGKNITDAASAILQVSSEITTFEEAQKKAGELIADIQDKTGRGYIATGKELQNIIIAQAASGVESDKLVERFKSMGYSLQSIPKEMQKVIDTSKALGVNVAGVAESVTANLKQMNLFNFSNGVEGLTRMAAQAGMFGIKMENIFQMSERLLDPEQAIDMAASLQRLGVAAGDLLDPLKLMDLGQNNPQELQNQIVEMSKQFTYFNEENQKMEILPGAKRQLREIADAMKIPVDELAQMALGSSELAKKMSEIRFPDLGIQIPEDQKTMIANMAEMKDGQYKIQVEETAVDEEGRRYGTGVVKEKAISELSPDDLESLQYQQKQNNKSLEDIATAAEATAGKIRGGAATTDIANQGVVQMNKSLKEFSNLFTGSFETDDAREGYQKLIDMSTTYFSKLDKLSKGGLDEKEKEEMKKMAEELESFSKTSLNKTTDFFSKFLTTVGKMPGDFLSSVSKTMGDAKKMVEGKETKTANEQDILNQQGKNIMDNILEASNKNKGQTQPTSTLTTQPITNTSTSNNTTNNNTTSNVTNNQNNISNSQQNITQNYSNDMMKFTDLFARLDLSKMDLDLSPLTGIQEKQLETSKSSYTELQTLNTNLSSKNQELIKVLAGLDMSFQNKTGPNPTNQNAEASLNPQKPITVGPITDNNGTIQTVTELTTPTNNNLNQLFPPSMQNITSSGPITVNGTFDFNVKIDAPIGTDINAIKKSTEEAIHKSKFGDKIAGTIQDNVLKPKVGSYNPTSGIPG